MTIRLITRTAMIAALALGAATSGAFAASSADEIRAALIGNTYTGEMGGGGYASYFGDDGRYEDASGGGVYEIGDDGVCYPDTDFGCYEAQIDGNQLEWFQNGESAGSGVIKEGNALE
ncbi:hypothetical protein [Roseovarius arcticus]|uniref:hypothetical protein n=1 Tax=Roseovarius arcticus TaxID=2547404 RepID=UPI0011102FF5|nr:hypothetical protein [Roseovarius arcticus]